MQEFFSGTAELESPDHLVIGNLCVQVSASKNRVYLDSGALIINVGSKEFDENLESQLVRGKRK